ncbi:MAG: hypothetical protein ACK5MR_15555 [Cumulibacter sp.]
MVSRWRGLIANIADVYLLRAAGIAPRSNVRPSAPSNANGSKFALLGTLGR